MASCVPNVWAKNKDFQWLSSILAVVLIMVIAGLLLSSRKPIYETYTGYLLRSLDGPMKYDDPDLVLHVKEKILEPPSSLPYNLVKLVHLESRIDSEKFYARFTRLFFKSQEKGFFIEAGALDGQTLSNTLWLEQAKGWTGLLVEPDPANYVALKRKHRKAWTAKVCLSVYKYPIEEKMSSPDIVYNQNYHRDIRKRSTGSFVWVGRNNTFNHNALFIQENANTYFLAQCLPLGTLLTALNVTNIDLLSLDIENVEEEVIRNFDFERFHIQVMFLEWKRPNKANWLRSFLGRRGFMLAANLSEDVVFVRKGSPAAKLLQKENLPIHKE